MDTNQKMEKQLQQLERDGFLLIKGALSAEDTEHTRQRINYARQ